MTHFCNPMNLEYRYQFFRKLNPNGVPLPFKVYREMADPSLILFKDTYFLFPSMTAGFFTSEDLHNWEFYEFIGEIPTYDYAPDVRIIGDYMYFSASHMGEPCDFYRTKDPRTEYFEEIKGTFPFWDPNLFEDEDGRVYFYWGCSNIEPIYGVEMNPETMTPLSEKQVMFDSDTENRGYERFGEEHIAPKSEEQIEAEVEAMYQNILKQAEQQGKLDEIEEDETKNMLRPHFGNRPYIEGPWMTKYNGKYYLQYAIPGTQSNVYGDGVYVSDKPLGPFTPAKNNPYSYKPGGFITGAGHGSTLEDRDGAFWHTSSMRISHNENFERRVGLWKAGFDEDGELFCDQRYGDWPVAMDAKPFDLPDWMLLSYKKKVIASSGNGAENLVDEDIRTFWKADTDESGEWVCIDLEEVQSVSAIQINFMDDGITVEQNEDIIPTKSFYDERYIDTVKQPTRWVLEGSLDGDNFFKIEDKSEVDTDLSHDFIELLETKEMRYIKLTILQVPYSAKPTLSGLRVFGYGKGDKPDKAELINVKYDGKMDLDISWKTNGAVGANILWGYSADKLYHSRMVYGDTKGHVGALVVGQPVFVRIDTFNESGITEGEVKSVVSEF